MKKKHHWTLVLAAGLLATAAAYHLTTAKSREHFSVRQRETLDAFVDSLHQNWPHAALAVAIVDGDALYYKAIGYCDSKNKLPFTDSTSFFGGNIAELVTAWAILHLAEQEKIDIDEPVERYVPYFRMENKRQPDITVKHLLTQTAGIPHHAALWDQPSSDHDALARTTRSIRLEAPAFVPPGSRILRSPYNYDILADLIEHVTGIPFEHYVKENLLQPAQLEASTFCRFEIPDDRLVKPHTGDGWQPYNPDGSSNYPYSREHAGSTGFHTSIKDMSALMFALVHEGKTGVGETIEREVYERFMTPQYRTGDRSFVGFAWEIKKEAGNLQYHKKYQLGGFSGHLALIPALKRGVFSMTNTMDGLYPEPINQAIVSWLDDDHGTIAGHADLYTPAWRSILSHSIANSNQQTP